MDFGFLADLIAFAWWKKDADAEANAVAESEAVRAAIPRAGNANAPRAWAAVADEWKDNG